MRLRAAVPALPLVIACAHGLPPSGLASDTGSVVDEGEFVAARSDGAGGGKERFRITARRDGGFIVNVDTSYDRNGEHHHVATVLETDASWRPLGGTRGVARIDVGGDLYADFASTALWTPLCALATSESKTVSLFPDRALSISASHDHHDGRDITLVSVDGPTRMTLVCSAAKLLVVNAGGVVVYRTGYKDLASSMLRATGPMR